MIESMKEKISKTDIYIKPDISGYNVISFDDGRDIIRKGEEASFVVYEKLKILGNTETYKLQSLKNESDSIQINRISFPDLKNFTRAYVIGKLGFKQPSKISYRDLKNGLNKLNATQNFSSIRRWSRPQIERCRRSPRLGARTDSHLHRESSLRFRPVIGRRYLPGSRSAFAATLRQCRTRRLRELPMWRSQSRSIASWC